MGRSYGDSKTEVRASHRGVCLPPKDWRVYKLRRSRRRRCRPHQADLIESGARDVPRAFELRDGAPKLVFAVDHAKAAIFIVADGGILE
jgi:hypothetical protein